MGLWLTVCRELLCGPWKILLDDTNAAALLSARTGRFVSPQHQGHQMGFCSCTDHTLLHVVADLHVYHGDRLHPR